MIEPGGLIRSLFGRNAARNYHSYVINEIGSAIVTGTFPVGSILASDAVMMEEYGVSRTVLREALKTLEAKGLVEARPKVGTRVSPTSRWNFFDPQVLSWHFGVPPDPHFYASLFLVRETLEAEAAELAAQHRTAEHVRLMKYWLHQMDTSADNIEQFGLAALELHRAIADASRNVLLRSVSGVVELTLALTITTDADTAAGFRAGLVRQCDLLLSAVERGAVDAARAAMLDVVAMERARVFGGIGAEAASAKPRASEPDQV